MFSHFFPQAQHCAKRATYLQFATLTSVLLGVTLFVACGGSASPGSNATTTTTTTAPPPTSLTISSALPAATVGSAYNVTLAVSGGSPPYAFSTTSGQLPAGVSLNTSSGSLSGTPTDSGSFSFGVSVADSANQSGQQALQITVANAPAPTPAPTPTPAPPPAPTPAPPTTSQSGSSFTDLQHSGGWGQFGQIGPNYIDCSPSPCNGISFWMAQDVQSPSLSGQASEYNVGGSQAFGDALWNNHLIGPSSSQGLPDNDRTLIPPLHDFTYDVYFYGDNLGLSQALEFDVNQFFNNLGFIWGHECRIAAGNEWDVWDNQKQRWVSTGIPCYPNSKSWNHLTIKVQRTSKNELLYQSITLNGVTGNLNWTFAAGSTKGWYGLTINFQMDTDGQHDTYNTYLDNLTFSYE
jgi:Putative Ig domain